MPRFLVTVAAREPSRPRGVASRQFRATVDRPTALDAAGAACAALRRRFPVEIESAEVAVLPGPARTHSRAGSFFRSS